jgi:hypothetical protein
MIMRFRPANISLINRRHYLPRLLLTLFSFEKNDQRILTGHYISLPNCRRAETIALKVISRPFTVVDDVRSDRSFRAKLGLCCGFTSVLLFGFFYVITNWRGHPGQAPVSVYFTFVALPIVVVLSVACSLIGTFKHSKWWVVVAILSGLYACLWFGTSSV